MNFFKGLFEDRCLTIVAADGSIAGVQPYAECTAEMAQRLLGLDSAEWIVPCTQGSHVCWHDAGQTGALNERASALMKHDLFGACVIAGPAFIDAEAASLP